MFGYKATNQDMTCRGHKFELGVWYEVEGTITLCENGFHFCEQPSGVWTYYSDEGTRVFKCEADGEVVHAGGAGAARKSVARRIRLIEEVCIGGNYNTGHYNTGYRNTGDYNTGYRNTGDYNTGNRNTGDRNTGYYNTGNRNTGNYNTGYCNTGNRNTGDYNTGYYNTGNGNATDYSSGMFCVKEPTVLSFDVRTKLTMREYYKQYPEYRDLCIALQSTDPIDFEKFSRLPGITKRKLKILHDKHLSSNSPDSGETE